MLSTISSDSWNTSFYSVFFLFALWYFGYLILKKNKTSKNEKFERIFLIGIFSVITIVVIGNLYFDFRNSWYILFQLIILLFTFSYYPAFLLLNIKKENGIRKIAMIFIICLIVILYYLRFKFDNSNLYYYPNFCKIYLPYFTIILISIFTFFDVLKYITISITKTSLRLFFCISFLFFFYYVFFVKSIRQELKISNSISLEYDYAENSIIDILFEYHNKDRYCYECDILNTNRFLVEKNKIGLKKSIIYLIFNDGVRSVNHIIEDNHYQFSDALSIDERIFQKTSIGTLLLLNNIKLLTQFVGRTDLNSFDFISTDTTCNDYVVVEKEGKKGITNTKGRVIVPTEYDSIYFPKGHTKHFVCDIFYKNIVCVSKNNKAGIYSVNGDVLLNTENSIYTLKSITTFIDSLQRNYNADKYFSIESLNNYASQFK